MPAAAELRALGSGTPVAPALFDPHELEGAESNKKGDEFRDAIEAQCAAFDGVHTVKEVAICDAPSMYGGWLKHDVAMYVPQLAPLGVPALPVAASLGSVTGRATPGRMNVNTIIEAKFMQNRGTVERSNQESVERLAKLGFLTGLTTVLVTHFSKNAVSATARMQLQSTCDVAAIPLLTFDDLREEEAFLTLLADAALAQAELHAEARAHLAANTLPPTSDRQLRQFVSFALQADFAVEETMLDAESTLC